MHGPSYVAAEGQRKLDKVNGVRKITGVIGTKEVRLSVGRKRNKRGEFVIKVTIVRRAEESDGRRVKERH